MMRVMPVENAVHEAARLFAAGDARAAAQGLRAHLAAGGLPPAAEADARYLLGRVLGALGDREGRAHEWVRVRDLDAAAPTGPTLMTGEEFEAAAAAALDELPRALLDELQGVGIMIEARPSAQLVQGGLDPRVLGLYHGVPLNRRSVTFGAPYADTIHLYSANLERVSSSRADLARLIRVTVLHETAHFFGYTEGQLRSMGLA